MNKRLAGHLVLLVLFVLATGWSTDRLWSAWSADGSMGRIILHFLATLGFISLSIRELRLVVRIRRSGSDGRHGDDASDKLHQARDR